MALFQVPPPVPADYGYLVTLLAFLLGAAIAAGVWAVKKGFAILNDHLTDLKAREDRATAKADKAADDAKAEAKAERLAQESKDQAYRAEQRQLYEAAELRRENARQALIDRVIAFEEGTDRKLLDLDQSYTNKIGELRKELDHLHSSVQRLTDGGHHENGNTKH